MKVNICNSYNLSIKQSIKIISIYQQLQEFFSSNLFFTMKNLTLDEIEFVKRKIQQFITLPTSPQKATTPNKHEQSKSPAPQRHKKKSSILKNNKNKSIDRSEDKVWLKKKQNQIIQYIVRQNRNKQSILNKYLNSDKIHLKPRQQVQDISSLKNKQQEQNKESNDSKSFSFDNNFSSLNKVYKKIGSLLSVNMNQEKKQQVPAPIQNQNPLFNFLSQPKSLQSSIPQKQQNKKNQIETETVIVKPSAMKGKISFNLPKQHKNQFELKKAGQNLNKQNMNKSNSKKALKNANEAKQPYLAKSSSEIQFEKRNKSSSFSNLKQKQSLNRVRQVSLSKKGVAFFKAGQNSQSKKSFQPYFDSQNQSTIREPYSNNFFSDFRKIQAGQYHSPLKKQFSNQKGNFSSSVYQRSFKKSPYEVTNQQKFLINKFRSKQISPDERSGLKDKYNLLEKRLDKILDSVKKGKQSANQSFCSLNLEDRKVEFHKVEIPEEILIYQKLSPLKKLVKINKNLKLQTQDSF